MRRPDPEHRPEQPPPAGTPAVALLRGRLHQACAVLAVPAAVRAARAASTPGARRAGSCYGAALVTVFSVSAAYHRGRWDPRTRRLLKQLDHAAIFGFAAASYAPLSMALPPAERRLLMTTVCSGAAVGSAVKAVRLDAQGGAADVLYLLVGWAGLLVLPALRRSLTGSQQALLLAGGVLYTAGACVLVRRWPDPVPAVFGYHEAGHLVMAGGTVLHYLLDLSVLAQS
ncbi:MAG: COG1272: Predicted membrane protein hemolysin III homolog [uncultured Frankineae bacterium]|uniref:COG1272: Predicted membrane protein hemolysin III homolog n=1 Tax=uncultured Frankineae bacterium TaxID=437475 RepID=A0A6J4LUC0_9ACTN|nr:MAG: COG1272: Predicted membrane protein hemolysin III homolog [uncultured Frankineae bacterium]